MGIRIACSPGMRHSPRMTPRKAPRALAVVVPALFSQACVLFSQAPADPPPPLPPPDAPEYAGAPPTPPPPVPPAPDQAARLSLSPIDQLLAPIALYPDPLIALILPASTAPADISAAQAYLVQYGDMARIDDQPWDPSVRALAHYPAVLTWMADNPEWTQALGAAFLASPADVMTSIQRLRARAWSDGVLASTPQQQVYSDNGEIEILPGQPDSIFVPEYDADAVFPEDAGDAYGGSIISFGPACDAGPWLSYCIDWEGGGIWVGGWGAWHGPAGWYRPHFSGRHGPTGAQPWMPGSRTAMPLPPQCGARAEPVPRPRPMQGVPAGPAGQQAGRTGVFDARATAAGPPYGAPDGGPRAGGGEPVSARSPAAASASHPAPAQSAPAAARDSSTSTSAASDPRNH
jgi:hypothetical protein